MPKVELGSIGVALNPGVRDAFVNAAAELDALGYSTIWVTGGPLENLGQLAEVLQATGNARVASAILSVDRFDAQSVVDFYAEMEADHPGRFILGLGGAHGAQPLQTLNAYLDRLDSVPVTARVLAALGPRMLELARRRASGAFPILITPEYAGRARAQLGDDTTLAIEQLVVVETDPERARQIARGPLGFLSRIPGYQASFRRMGFTDDDIASLSDRLVDAVVVWGDVDAIRVRVAALFDAGADHVALSVTPASPDTLPVDGWRELAAALIRR
jgi:probable F420-dependent oxidoreductase